MPAPQPRGTKTPAKRPTIGTKTPSRPLSGVKGKQTPILKATTSRPSLVSTESDESGDEEGGELAVTSRPSVPSPRPRAKVARPTGKLLLFIYFRFKNLICFILKFSYNSKFNN